MSYLLPKMIFWPYPFSNFEYYDCTIGKEFEFEEWRAHSNFRGWSVQAKRENVKLNIKKSIQGEEEEETVRGLGGD